ncbi:MAG: HIT domain-containing protein [Chloroflexi bacterium]|nr:MAG: HIT domain-containing protein [Chloroflexota bacterium]
MVDETDQVAAFMDQYRQPSDPGHVLVIPRAHVENIYGVGDSLGGHLFSAHARIAR